MKGWRKPTFILKGHNLVNNHPNIIYTELPKDVIDHFICLGFTCAGTDPEDTILNAFKMFDPDAKGFIHKDE